MATQEGRKRKRDEALEEDVNSKIAGKIHHEKKLVHKACKKTKIFEIQKVVQRLKNERQKNAGDTIISNYEAELSCLKTVNDGAIGNSAFRSKILKDHTLRTNQVVLSFLKDLELHLSGPVEPGSLLAKIQSRLLSSKILSAQIAASVESLRVLVNPAFKPRKAQNTSDKATVQVPQESKREKSSRQSTPSEEDNESLPPMADDPGWESGTVDMKSGITDGDSDHGWSHFPGSPALSNFEAQVETETDEECDGSGHEPVDSPVVRNSGGHDISDRAKKARSSITESTFLPSLSVGFIQGSDSDFDDAAEIKAADMRKNRRGQRARRAIWEKKYGRHANHKKKEAEERAAAFAKKTAKARMPNVIRRTISGWERAGKELNNVREVNSSTSKDERPLHPSWEAKRKQKDRDRGSIVPSQGKKIKF